MLEHNDKMVTLTKDKIQISFDYDPHLVSVVRDLPDRTYDPARRRWVVPNSAWHAHKVAAILQPHGFDVRELLRTTSSNCYVDENPMRGMVEGLYSFQRECVQFIIRANGRAIIADEMGCGKTVEALAYVNMVGGKTLIISPSVGTYKWKAEVERWVEGSPTVQVISSGKDKIQDVDFIITSYALAVNVFSRLSKFKFDNLIVDEFHYIKNYKAARTRTVKSLAKSAGRLLFLSGTPMLNRPSELFPALNMLDSKAYPNFYSFARSYCGAYYDQGMWVFPDTLTNENELHERLQSVMIRRTKREVLTELPDLARVLIPVRLASSDRSLYNQTKRDAIKWIQEHKRTATVLQGLAGLRQLVGAAKVKSAIELAQNILESDDKKVVLFAHHKAVVRTLEKELKPYGALTIVGDTTQAQRLANANAFLNNPRVRAIIISTAGSEAIDLYSASDIIFVERQWTPAAEEQAESRLHRNGQKNSVTAHYLVAMGTIDERLSRVVDQKRKMIGQIIKQDDIVTEIISSLLEDS